MVEDKNETMKESMAKIQENHGLPTKIIGNDEEGYAVFTENLPKSENQAIEAKNFWEEYLQSERVQNIDSITFVNSYEEELPLTNGQKFLNLFGYNANPQKEEKLSYQSIDNVFDAQINSEKGLAAITTNNQAEWEHLNEIEKKSNSFSAPYTFLPYPHCNRVHVPLSTIYKVETKNKPLGEEKKQE
ncbi:MAG: hypothetical protein ABEI74_02205 [Candidatus Pacearchaeota archaeon]